MSRPEAFIVNGWCLLTHPLFTHQFENLVQEVEKFHKTPHYPNTDKEQNWAMNTSIGFEQSFFSNIGYFLDTTSKAKLLFMLGSMIQKQNAPMIVDRMLITYLKKC